MYKQNMDITYHQHINITDSNGNTPLHYSIEHQHENVTKLLIARGSDIDIMNANGKTPMDLIKNKDTDKAMHNAIKNGLSTLKQAKKEMNTMLCAIKICRKKIVLPIEIGLIIVDYIDAFEIMEYYGTDEFSKNNDKTHSNEYLTSYYVMNKNNE